MWFHKPDISRNRLEAHQNFFCSHILVVSGARWSALQGTGTYLARAVASVSERLRTIGKQDLAAGTQRCVKCGSEWK